MASKKPEPLSKFNRYVRLRDQETFDSTFLCQVILIHSDDEKEYLKGPDGNGVDLEELPEELIEMPRTIVLSLNDLIEFYVEHHAKE